MAAWNCFIHLDNRILRCHCVLGQVSSGIPGGTPLKRNGVTATPPIPMLRADANLNKASPNYFENPLGFFFGNGRCMFCPGSGTKQPQSCVRREGEMNKRKLGSFALCTMLFGLWLPAEAQQQTKKVPLVGVLSGRGAPTPTTPDPNADAFRQGLLELGYVEGKNIAIEYRFAEGKADHLSGLAMELVRLKVDAIFTAGTPATFAARNATKTIPIVFTSVGDPVGVGLVTSLARPGGNVTGLSILAPELGGKGLELLKETAPKVSRVAVLWNADNPSLTHSFREAEVAARAMRLQLQSLEVRGPNGIEPAFRAAKKERAGALIVLRDLVTIGQQKRIVELALKNRLPTMYNGRDFVEAGGLMSYAPSYVDLYRRAATYVDKILKGTKPADLPVEQPVKFEFIINLKTAKQIGLTIPPNVLARADKVFK
jgi:putative tryptophan/tyrosine transport system substrate-binding protein